MPNEGALFLRQLIRRPKQVSALAPSSRALARAMAAGLGPQTGPVVEFGPGTGRITEAILARGVPPRQLTLFEMNPDFATHLRLRFPGVTVHVAGAEMAASHVTAGVGAVISGLPLLSMPVDVRTAILNAAFDVLAPGGTYVQFTYGPKPPIPPEVMTTMGLAVAAGPKIWANIPPARVFTFHRIKAD
jgi:phosphatidylethanolamine/phosphatidyl-N-methylethanolamine N-methyltransferase